MVICHALNVQILYIDCLSNWELGTVRKGNFGIRTPGYGASLGEVATLSVEATAQEKLCKPVTVTQAVNHARNETFSVVVYSSKLEHCKNLQCNVENIICSHHDSVSFCKTYYFYWLWLGKLPYSFR